MIRLGQFLKFANLVETGGQARELIAAGAVAVNGEVETRRGRQLHPGDEVTLTTVDGPTTVEVDLSPVDVPW
ncbi:RNA-binding S4 domain-containing protein [Acidipropionibacterium timonense]|uniref:RNA-binding S4 domain-containing protein n=1 Tax=Acidipropionibacterium timonense TaxID=2161818 RepID=UPI00102FA07F|nr:RNA-binding S4 domain-containing protein [Acidipropionibacterium timonense]